MKVWSFRLLVLGWVAGVLYTTAVQQRVWQTDLSLWVHAAQQTPYRARVFANLGWALERYGYHAQALVAYRRAVDLSLRYPAQTGSPVYAGVLAQLGVVRMLARFGAIDQAGTVLNGLPPETQAMDAAQYTRALLRLLKGQCTMRTQAESSTRTHTWTCATVPLS